MVTRLRLRCSLAAAVLLFVLTVPGAYAASEVPATDQGAGALDEIVVTAEKRVENVQKVPVAVSVISPVGLANAGAVELDQLAKVSPSLTITPEANPTNASIVLRGIGTFAFSIAAEPSVSVIIDDVPQALQAQAFATDLIDIDRVEVLRGPQSTLFGKSASAGIINITTKAPTDHLTGTADLMATTDREERVSGTLSGPITKDLLFRLTASYDDFAGNARDLTNDTWVDGEHQVNVVSRLVWTPTEALKIDIGFTHQILDSDCCAATYAAISPTASMFGIAAPGFTGADVTRGEVVNYHNDALRMDSPLYYNSVLAAANGKVSYELPSGLSLMSITSHAAYTSHDGVDNDFSDLNFIPAYSKGAVSGYYIQYGDLATDSWTQEFRVTSPDSGPVRYVAGLYYQDDENRRDLLRGPAVSIVNYNAYAWSKSYAAYSQATFDIQSDTRIIGGIRYNTEDIAYSFDKNTTDQTFGRTDTDSVVTWRAGVQHDFARDVMGYAMYTRGYKGQAYDLTSALNAAIASAQPIKAEKSNSYELGLRSEFLDRRVTMNVTGFWANYSNFQAQGVVPDITGASILANVGVVRTRGVEFESLYRITDDFRVNLAMADTDARILRYPNAACYTAQTAAEGCVGGIQNIAGGTLPDSPHWKSTLGSDYTLPLANLPFDGTFNAYYTYQTKVIYALSQDPSTRMGGYGIVNVNAGIASHSGTYKVSLFVNNLFDRQYYDNIESHASEFQGQTAVSAFLPRDFHRYGGVRFSVSF